MYSDELMERLVYRCQTYRRMLIFNWLDIHSSQKQNQYEKHQQQKKSYKDISFHHKTSRHHEA
jgi:hypothetical protein